MSLTAEVVKTLYQELPQVAQALVDQVFAMGGAERRVKDLEKKASMILPSRQEEASKLRKELNGIWKSCKEDGLTPDIAKVQEIFKAIKPITEEIRTAQDTANCGTKERSLYRDAFDIYKGMVYSHAEEIKGKTILVARPLSPTMLLQINAVRLARKTKNK